MTNIQTLSALRAATFTLILFATISLFWANTVSAAEKCSFTRDLEVGVDGEDVRCLQKYLNSAGHKLAESGPGAPGSETTLFRDGTKAAVVKWQSANGVSPASGYFGPVSRAKYETLVSGSTSGDDTSTNSQRDEILARIAELQGKTNQTSSSGATTASTVKEALQDAIESIRDAEEQIDEVKNSGTSIGRAEDRIVDAREDFYSAVEAYLDGNNLRAVSMAEDARENALDAFEDAGGETEEDEVEEYLEELEDDIDAAWTRVEDADDDGDDVERSEELLEEAEDLLEKAEEKLDDGDVDEARDLGEEVEDLIDDAIDAIGEGSDEEEEAEEAIEDAEDAINDAEDAIDEAKDNDEDTDDAEELLEEAEDLLEEAEEAFDDEDFDEAIELAEEAEDLADEAVDEL